MKEKGYNIELKEDSKGLLYPEFKRAALHGGNILCTKEPPENSMCDVLYNDEVIGYRCSFKNVSLHGQKRYENLKIDKENEKSLFAF